MAGLDIKSLGNPDEVRPFADEKGAAHILNLTRGGCDSPRAPRRRWCAGV